MDRIRQLTPEVFTKIAAGEVIERPASVVKELLENALDAGADRIEIAVENGGADLIRVVDNGRGMVAEDLPLAFASHATSKLASADDLFRVSTYGFRGEALASIGSVAQVTLQSRTAEAECGAELSCNGGSLGPVRPWNGAVGTRIEVRNLFFNTPVRRKFLRSPATELGHISEAITRLALARESLQVQLTHNSRDVFTVPASAGLRERIGLFFGPEVAQKLYPVELSQGPARLSGFIADPACDRGTPKLQYLFVNGRCIRDRSLSHALQEGYRGLIMVGRHCVAFLFLELPADHVDVNVHPAKAEVRFRDGSALYSMLLAAVRDRLRREELVPRFQPQRSAGLQLIAPPLQSPWQLDSDPREAGAPLPWQPQAKSVERRELSEEPRAESEDLSTLHAPRSTLNESPAARAIQLHDAYLVVESPQGMLVIDQHALHERIIYESWKARLRDGAVESQRLLVPEPVDLPGEQAALALENRTLLAELGLGVEDFGGGTVLVTSYPALLRNGRPAQLLRTAVEHLASVDRPPTREQLLDELLKLMACRSAIKAGDHLGPEEVSALLARRDLADHTHHCPHGRPTALLLSKQELDRQFKRT